MIQKTEGKERNSQIDKKERKKMEKKFDEENE